MILAILSLFILLDSGHKILQKYLSHRLPAAAITLGSFFICTVVALVYQYEQRHSISFPQNGLLIAAIASVNATAAWLYLRAVKINLTRATLLTPVITVISLLLAVIFLGEWRLLNPTELPGACRLVGIILGIAALGCFSINRNNDKITQKSNETSATINAAGAVFLWGVTNFLLKYFALKAIPTDQFLTAWYPGAWLASLLIFTATGRLRFPTTPSKKLSAPSPRLRHLILIGMLGCLTIANLGVTYYALTLAPAVIVLSIHDLIQMGGGTLIGILLYSERQHFRRQDSWGIISGIGATMLFTAATIMSR